MFRRLIGLFIAVAMLTGCEQQGDERLAEKARIESEEATKADVAAAYERGKKETEAQLQTQIDNIDKIRQMAREEGAASARAQVDEENANLSRRAQEMESDLAIRHRFFQTVRGTYEGTYRAESGDMRIRLTLVPNLAPYPVGRVRALEEITTDLTNLFFSAQIIQWSATRSSDSTRPVPAVGCRIEQIRPDLKAGSFAVASEACPNFYALRLSSEATSAETPAEGQAGGQEGEKPLDQVDTSLGISNALSMKLAEEAMKGKLKRLDVIEGIVQPTTNAAIYPFKVKRVGQ